MIRLVAALVVCLGVGACSTATRQPVTSPATPTFGFSPADGLFLAERDLHWTGSTPHCIVRIVLASAPDGLAVYAEAPIEWCSGVD